MEKKVSKKKTSSPSKTPPKKKAVKKKSSAPKKRVTRKNAVKKKTPVQETRAPQKRVARKSAVKKKTPAQETPTPKKRVARKSAVKKKTPAQETSTPKKRVARKSAVKKKTPAQETPTPKKRVARKSAVKKKAPAQKTRVPQKKAIKKAATVRISTIRGKIRKSRRNKKYMDAEQLEYFRSILLARRNELINEADRMVGYMQTGSNTYADTIDQANQEEEFTLRLKERDRERKLLRKIDEALAKIDRHEYGFCVSCGGEIGISRLKVRPTTDQCIDCKELDELKERHY